MDHSLAAGSLTFNPGQTSQTIAVAITDDTLDEPNETVILALSNATNATVGTTNRATLTIVDNDEAEEEFHIYLPLVLR